MKRIFGFLLVLCLLPGLVGCGQSGASTAASTPTWQEQYDLGVRYLSEGNYQEAILAFTAAIEIDPKRPEAYLGLADVYLAQGDPEQARSVLEAALSKVDDPAALEAKLAELTEAPQEETDGVEIISEGAVSKVEGSLSLSQISYYILKDGEEERLCLDYIVDGPENVRNVKCAGGVSLSYWNDARIAKTISNWKEWEINEDNGMPPFQDGAGISLDPEEHGTQVQMSLFGTDANGEFVGVSCVTVDVP